MSDIGGGICLGGYAHLLVGGKSHLYTLPSKI